MRKHERRVSLRFRSKRLSITVWFRYVIIHGAKSVTIARDEERQNDLKRDWASADDEDAGF